MPRRVHRPPKASTWCCAKGEFVAIVGKVAAANHPAHMITASTIPAPGMSLLGAPDITRCPKSARSLWRGRNLGVVFQFFQLLPMLTLLENVMLPMDYVGMYDFYERPKRAMELLKLVAWKRRPTSCPWRSPRAAAERRHCACPWPTTHRSSARMSPPQPG